MTPPAGKTKDKPNNDVPSEEAQDRLEAEAAESEAVSVHVALSRVMAEVQHVSKQQRNTQQNYNFRGIDAVVNAVGPALRKHGVIVVPTHVEYSEERYQTKKGAEMKGVVVRITFRFYGPLGDHVEAMAAGEAADAGDKATPKAHSVAFRTLLLQALCIPTDEPDPDESAHERGAPVVRETETKVPKSWPEINEGLGKAIGNEADRAWWMDEVVEVRFGKPKTELTRPELQVAGQSFATAFIELVDGNPDRDPFGFPTRMALQQTFAMAFDGVKVEGPPWRLGPEETELPTRDEWAANKGDVPEGDTPEDDIPFGDDDEPPGGSGASDAP